ncbi:MAG TPA: peptidoglycan-binding domain-containing protein [Aliidongia sp.]|nr:peptidoglycan-binding domain-containing protein [Aliidongia sp.]
MKTRIWPHVVYSRLAVTVLLLGAALLCHPGTAAAADCGGPLSTSTGNIVGSTLGAVGGGLLGSQFGGGAGKGVVTGLGVVGGALAGGYAGRSVEGCPGHRAAARQAAGPGGRPRTCRFVNSQATIEGQAQQVEGIACLEQDGSWRTETGPAAEQAASADLVLRAQQRLHDQGFYVRNNVDGRWGPATSAAVGNFQQANGMASTGQLDPPTRTALGLDPVPLTDLAQAGQPAGTPPPATTPVSAPSNGEPGSLSK